MWLYGFLSGLIRGTGLCLEAKLFGRGWGKEIQQGRNVSTKNERVMLML
jgi:hypothetical protein